MDISSYFKYAFRLWQFDETAAQELREQEASSIWMSLGIILLFGLFISSINTVTEIVSGSSVLVALAALFCADLLQHL